MISAWSGLDGEEYAVAFDRGRERRILILPALFDEANKLRHFTVEVMRRLDAAGIDTFLPDLPGTNESLAPLGTQTLQGWRDAAESAASHSGATHTLAIRGGALCAPRGLPAWCYAPANGSSILRAMLRARVIASKEAGIEETRDGLLELGRVAGLDLAGYRLDPAMIAELEIAEPLDELGTGAALANIAQSELGGAGLWLRAEPDHDPAQAAALAGFVANACERPSTGSGRAELVSIPSPAHPEPVERRHLTFACEGEILVGTLDEAPGEAGLLLVSGGNEIRAGAFAGQAQLAARLAAAGFPVFRYDRRGIGDSTGDNRGFRDSGADIAAALAAFKAECPTLARVVGFGNCDAASALMLNTGAGCDALVLTNPWTIEHDDGAPPPAAIRARYAEKLKNPKELLRLATGKVSLRKLAGGLGKALKPAPPPTSLAEDMRAGLEGFDGPVRLLIAERDRTGQAFAAAWPAADPRLAACPGASHAFVEPASRDWLFEQILAALKG